MIATLIYPSCGVGGDSDGDGVGDDWWRWFCASVYRSCICHVIENLLSLFVQFFSICDLFIVKK